uniref:DDE Tnp4 domain-containing protein n=2 Tax=Hordeum vulgare subsp. vulgare TaxID=112509 RepID=A0A8I6YYU5_HORVV
MELIRLVEWEEWDWEEQVQAFPVLQVLTLDRCKLKCLPPGLASQARALNKLIISYVQGLISIENFPSLVELDLDENLDLERITNLPRLQKLTIEDCPKLKVLEGVPALQRLMLTDKDMETLPIYMGGINPRHLELCCRLALLASIAAGQSGLEWDKFRHVGHVKAYAGEGGNSRKWYVLYTAKPYNLETNVSFSFMSRGTLSYFEDAQRFQFVFKMTRETFSYICSLVMEPSMQDMNSYTFVNGRVLSLQDRVAVALRRLHSSEPTGIVGSSVGVNESTALSVTERFVDAMWEQADHHSSWPDCNEKDEIKSKFEKIHKMNNCCGVICATQIPFGPNWEKNKTTQMQVIVDPEMRFRNIWLGSAGSINHINILYDSHLFNGCEKGGRLNGSKLKVALDGSEVGEYIIGDTGYPLLPWLLTPYQEEDLSDTKAEFNRRHSAARTCALKAMARLKDTWKCLQGEVWWPANLETLSKIIYACCRLHNIVIELEDDAAMLSTKRKNYSMEVREIAKEDAVRARDMLSQHFMASRSSKSGEQDDEAASSGPGDENNEQEVQTINYVL